MSTDVARINDSNDLAQQVEYANLASAASMLPTQYRGKPADILIAVGLGRAMGLSPAESLYRIHVIQGRPTAAAELIAANVRRAGHRLRVVGDDSGARATIVRADDPDFEFEAIWNPARAKAMGLAGKDGWQKQPGTMMKWRAITEVARMACPEALYGVVHSTEEIDDTPRTTRPTTGLAAELVGEIVPTSDGGAPPPEAEGPPVEDTPDAPPSPITDKQRRHLFAAFTGAGFDTDARSDEGRTARLAYLTQILGRDVASTNDLTSDEAGWAIGALEADAQQSDETGGE